MARCSGLGFTSGAGFLAVMVLFSVWCLIPAESWSELKYHPSRNSLLTQVEVGASWESNLAAPLPFRGGSSSQIFLLSTLPHHHISAEGYSLLFSWLWPIGPITFRLTNTRDSPYWLILTRMRGNMRMWGLPNPFTFKNWKKGFPAVT